MYKVYTRPYRKYTIVASTLRQKIFAFLIAPRTEEKTPVTAHTAKYCEPAGQPARHKTTPSPSQTVAEFIAAGSAHLLR
jgi:hypothetical protein